MTVQLTEAITATTRVLVVDDHRAFADLLAFALSAQPDISCVGVATSIAEGLARAVATRPDVVLLDISINGEDGLVALPRFRAACPDAAVAVLTAHRGGLWSAQANNAGAAAFIPKDGPLSDVLDALRGLDGGPMFVAGARRVRPTAAVEASGCSITLTPREHDVLDGLGRGLPAKLIARSLGITVQTCRSYIKTLMVKLGTGSQLETVLAAQRLGLLPTLQDV
jgi:DNA-binding NarL/FixJ family response regulator